MIIGPKLSPVDTRHCTISIVPAIPKPPASPNPAQDKSIRPRVSPGRNRICIQCRTLQMTTSRGESPPTFPDTRPSPPPPFGPFRVHARPLFFHDSHALNVSFPAKRATTSRKCYSARLVKFSLTAARKEELLFKCRICKSPLNVRTTLRKSGRKCICVYDFMN